MLADSPELTSRALLLFLNHIDEIWTPKRSESTET